MKLGRNLLAGLTSSIWSALVGLLVVPLYLRYLGVEAYGLIGFYMTMQAVLSLLDMGLATTINREVARCSASGAMPEAGKLLHTLAVVYWCVAFLIALMIVGLSPWIAGYWLQSSSLSVDSVERAVALMGVVIACRWPIGLYQGALFGAERMSITSVINIIMTTFVHGGGVALLAIMSPTIDALFMWQAGAGMLHAVLMRSAAWRVINKDATVMFDVNKLRSVLRFSLGMGGIALSAAVFTQLDKVILSNILTLESFGRYMLATTVVSSLYIIIMPIFNAIYPRLSILVATEDSAKLVDFYCMGTRAFTTVLFSIAMVLVVFSEELVYLWLNDRGMATEVAPIVSLLAAGSALHGVMFFPYALQLAYGDTKLPLTINAALMVVQIPLIIILSLNYGAIGGASAWFILHVLYVLSGTWLTHRRVLKGVGLKWLLKDVLLPLGLSIMLGFGGYWLKHRVNFLDDFKLVLGAALALTMILLSLALMPKSFRRGIQTVLLNK